MAAGSQHAVDFIVETLRREPAGTVTLCALGPMTNLASAFARAPDVVPRVARIVAMGGGRSEGGNITPVAEFNVYADPHAARAVFGAGVPIVLHPLDVTHRAVTSDDRIAAFRALGTRAGTAVAEMLAFAQAFDMERYGADGGPLHDPNVIAFLSARRSTAGRLVNVEVETESELTMGQTVVDWWGATDRPRNVHYITEVDDTALFALLVERIGRLRGCAGGRVRSSRRCRIRLENDGPSALHWRGRRRAGSARHTEESDLTHHAPAARAATPAGAFVPLRGNATATLLSAILASLDDDKAEDIVTIPLAGKSEMADHMVIASGRSSRQVSAIAEHLADRLKQDAASSRAPRARISATGC